MPALGPRPTDPDAWMGWLREALGLIAQRPSPFIGYTAAVALAQAAAHTVAWQPVRVLLILVVAVLALGAFLRLALVADYNRPARADDVLPGNLEVATAVAVSAVLFTAYGALGPAVFTPLGESLEAALTGLGLYEPRLESGAPAPEPVAVFLVGPVLVAGGIWGVSAAAAGLVLLLLGQWFLLPMVALHAAPPAMAMAVSPRAYTANPVAMTGLLGLLALGLGAVLLSAGWLGPLLAPVLGALLYTSYRDVFLGRAQNHPSGPPVPTPSELAAESRGEDGPPD